MAKARIYILSIYFITSILLVITGGFIYYEKQSVFLTLIITLVLLIPLSEIVQQFINYILNKKIKPTIIPKMDFSKRHSRNSTIAKYE